MKLNWLIYPLRIFYIFLGIIVICTIPVFIVIMGLTPIMDVFWYISTGRFQIMEAFCDWFFGKYPDYYLEYLKPENILQKITEKYGKKNNKQ